MMRSHKPRATGTRSAAGGGLWDVFEANVARRPDAIAAADLDRALTYRQAHDAACRLATTLAGRGVGPGNPVIVCLDRTVEAVIGSLAVVATGATVVPVDADCPPIRLQSILGTTGAAVWLVDDQCTVAPARGRDLVHVTDRGSHPHVPVAVRSSDVAYLLFTSGSTGRPKGVEITHANLLSLLSGASLWESSGQDDVWAALSAFTFDASLWEMWRPLSQGSQVFVMPRSARVDVEHLRRLIDHHGITSLCVTPTATRLLADELARVHDPIGLRRLLIGGERLDFGILAPFADAVASGRTELWNMYGPTETTVYATGHRVCIEDITAERRALIGRPLPRVDVQVSEPDADGVGELMIYGPGVSNGYRDDADRTAAGFFSAPVDGGWAYRTGDRGKATSDGALEFLGRSGGYVKVRGYRVELGEVVAALRSHDEVADAFATVVDIDGRGESIICAVLPRTGSAVRDIDLRRHLARCLPAYMRPARTTLFEDFPLLASQKVDHMALRVALVDRSETTAGPAAWRADRQL